MTIRRVNRGKGHSYIDDETGQKVPGVTSFLDKGVPKPALINWSASATVDYAIDHWEALSALTPSARAKELLGARYAVKDAAANKGTKIHALASRLIHGEAVTVPDGLEGYVESYVRFLDEWDVQPVLVEATVISHAHGYCGTLDLVADLLDPDMPGERVRWLLDVKSNRSGIFGETALQLAGYRYSDAYIDGDIEAEVEMPTVDRTGAVWVRQNGYDLVPVEADEPQHRQFLYAQQMAGFVETSRDLVGEPLAAPYPSTYRLTREER